MADPDAAVGEPMEPRPHRVVGRADAGPQMATLALAPLGAPLPRPRPGQFVMVWAFGVGEVPISVSGIGTDGTLELTVRIAGATSSAIVDADVGDLIGLRGPYGTAWPMAAAAGRDVVVMGGGLGVAPLRLAIVDLAGGRPRPRRLTILVGARQPDQLLYAVELAALVERGFDVRTTVDAADRGWHGAVGTVTQLLERQPVSADLALVCGPEPMMRSAASAIARAGVDPAAIHVSLERNMHCGVAHCGRCQLGPLLLCRDGPVTTWDRVAALMEVRGR